MSSKLYHQLHREEDNARCRKYHQKHKEQGNADSRKYHWEHRDELLIKQINNCQLLKRVENNEHNNIKEPKYNAR